MQPFCQDFFIFACRGQRLVVQRDSDGDVRRGQLTAICRLQDQLTQGLALLAVNEPGRRFVRIEQIVVCPLGEGDQHRLQGTALIGQDILLPGAAVGGRLQALADQLQARYAIQASILKADLSEEHGIAAVEQRLQQDPAIDLFINNAGTAKLAGFLASTPREHQAIHTLNTQALLAL